MDSSVATVVVMVGTTAVTTLLLVLMGPRFLGLIGPPREGGESPPAPQKR